MLLLLLLKAELAVKSKRGSIKRPRVPHQFFVVGESALSTTQNAKFRRKYLHQSAVEFCFYV